MVSFFIIERNDIAADRSIPSKKDNVASFDVHTDEEKKIMNKTTTESYKIHQHEIKKDYIDGNNDFVCVDQMTTPSHALFENECEYQNVLMDIF